MIQKLIADEEVREIYKLRQQTEFGYISEKNIAVQKAKEEGRTEGEKIGIEKGEKIGIEKGEKIGIEKGEKIGIEKGEKIGIEKGEKIGIEKGEKIGIEKGERIGEHKKAIETAKKLLNKGLEISDIAECTGLAVEEIEKLK